MISIQVPAPPEIPLPPWMFLSPQAMVLISLGFFAACAVVLFPLARALARRLEGDHASRRSSAEWQELRARVQELEAAQGRLAELENRLDFTERLLSQRREQERIGGGAG